MDINSILFSVNDYDQDGDVCTAGVFLHFGDTRIKVASNAHEFRAVAETIRMMTSEVEEVCANKKL